MILSNIGRFVEWPAGGPLPAADSRSICVLGEDPFGPALDEVVRGRQSQGRSVAVRRYWPGFTARAGMVNFFVEGGRVRFDINAGQVNRTGLRISSQLLELARKAKRGGPGGS